MVPEKMRFGSPSNLENQLRVQAGARFSSFVRFQKKLDFGWFLELHFRAFGTFLRRKHSFLGRLKITLFCIEFCITLVPQNGIKKQSKIDPLGHLAPTWLQEGVILSQHGSRGTHPRRFSLIFHHFVIDFEVDFFRSIGPNRCLTSCANVKHPSSAAVWAYAHLDI